MHLSKENISVETRTAYFYKGRIALLALLRAIGVGKGDEVIMQSYTCLAVPLPVISLGATPVYVDIDSNTLCMNVGLLKDKITPRTKAIIVQHTFGVPADMDGISRIARAENIGLIEDCCHSPWSLYNNMTVGNFGDAAFYSYEWGKPIIAGIGGSCIVRNADLAKKLEMLSREYKQPPFIKTIKIRFQRLAYSMIVFPGLFWIVRDAFRLLGSLGIAEGTFHRDELLGSLDHDRLLLPRFFQKVIEKKAARSERAIRMRKRLAEEYRSMAKQLDIKLFDLPRHVEPVYLRLPLRVRKKKPILELARKMRIELGDWFVSPIHPLVGSVCRLAGYEEGACPESERAAAEIITLPIHCRISKNSMAKMEKFLRIVQSKGWL